MLFGTGLVHSARAAWSSVWSVGSDGGAVVAAVSVKIHLRGAVGVVASMCGAAIIKTLGEQYLRFLCRQRFWVSCCKRLAGALVRVLERCSMQVSGVLEASSFEPHSV